jgi:hypothetical protein
MRLPRHLANRGGILRVPLSDGEIEDASVYIPLTFDPAASLPAPDEASAGTLGLTLSWIHFAGAALILMIILICYY